MPSLPTHEFDSHHGGSDVGDLESGSPGHEATECQFPSDRNLPPTQSVARVAGYAMTDTRIKVKEGEEAATDVRIKVEEEEKAEEEKAEEEEATTEEEELLIDYVQGKCGIKIHRYHTLASGRSEINRQGL